MSQTTGDKKRRVRPVVPHPPAGAERVMLPGQDGDLAPDDADGRAVESSAPRAPAPALDAQPQVTVLQPGEEGADSAMKSWVLDVGSKDVGQLLTELRKDVGYWVQKGRYNKVRLLREGKPMLPDIPVGVIMAAELAGLAWAGALRTALVNVAGRLMFKVELINDAQEHLAASRKHYEQGDMDEAESEAVRALKVDPRLPEGFLLLGTFAKVRGKPEEALRHFRKAKDLDPHGEIGRQAEVQARKLDPDFAPSPGAEKP